MVLLSSCEEGINDRDSFSGQNGLSSSPLLKSEKDKNKMKSKNIKDVDGNKYLIVQIGEQTWMAENLRTTKFNDGTDIPLVTDESQWADLETPGYCYYNNDITNEDIYGALYNWYAIDAESNGNKNVCPTGWHVPSHQEWYTLRDYLSPDAGDKLKATTLWESPSSEADNSSGFTAYPGGYRNTYGVFEVFGTQAYFWSSSKYYSDSHPTGYAWFRYLINTESNLQHMFAPDNSGMSIRCVKEKNKYNP